MRSPFFPWHRCPLELDFAPELEFDIDDVDQPFLLEYDSTGHVLQSTGLHHVVHLVITEEKHSPLIIQEMRDISTAKSVYSSK